MRRNFLLAFTFLAAVIVGAAMLLPGMASPGVSAHAGNGYGSPPAVTPGTEPPTAPPTAPATVPATPPSTPLVKVTGNCGNGYFKATGAPVSVYTHVVYNGTDDRVSKNPVTLNSTGIDEVIIPEESYTSIWFYATDASGEVVSNVAKVTGCNVVVTPTPSPTQTSTFPSTVPPTVPSTPSSTTPATSTVTPTPPLTVTSLTGDCGWHITMVVSNPADGVTFYVYVQYQDDSPQTKSVPVALHSGQDTYYVTSLHYDTSRVFNVRAVGSKVTSGWHQPCAAPTAPATSAAPATTARAPLSTGTIVAPTNAQVTNMVAPAAPASGTSPTPSGNMAVTSLPVTGAGASRSSSAGLGSLAALALATIGFGALGLRIHRRRHAS